MSGTAVDNILHRLKQRSEKSGDASASVARFLVTKLSWRGNYRRILAITPNAVITQHPDSLAVTNVWLFTGDCDLASIEVGGSHAEGDVFTLHARKDKQGSTAKDAKFACKDRTALLTALYKAISTAALTQTTTAASLLGTTETFPAYKLRKGVWVPATLRVTSYALERLYPSSNNAARVAWKLEYRHAASPFIRLLKPTDEALPAGTSAFAVFGRVGRSPRVYATSQRDRLLKSMQAAALRMLGVTLAVDSMAAVNGRELLSSMGAAERERAAEQSEAPLGEWEVTRVYDHAGPAVGSSNSDLSTSRMGQETNALTGVAHRRLVLTKSGILERRPATYEVAEWRQLASIAAIVRYVEDPQWLAVEWTDGAPAAVFVTPARDAVLASLVDAAQLAAGRAIPVLAQPTVAGEALGTRKTQSSGAAAAVESDLEVERLLLGQLSTAARDFISAAGPGTSLASLTLAGLTAGGWSSTSNNNNITSMQLHPSVGSESIVYDTRTHSEDGGSASAADILSSPRLKSGTVTYSATSGQNAVQVFATFQQRMREFNACVAYYGVAPNTRVDEQIIVAILAHLPSQAASATGAASRVPLGPDEAALVVTALQCLQRLVSAPLIGLHLVGPAGGSGRIFSALLSQHDHVSAESARLLLRMFSPVASRLGIPPWALHDITNHAVITQPPRETSEEITSARAIKSICFISNSRCENLLGPLKLHRAPSAYLAMSVAETAAAVACTPGSSTTEPATKQALLTAVAGLGRPLFALFESPSERANDAASLLMRGVAQDASDAAAPLRDAALSEGALLRHLIQAVGPAGARQEASRQLLALWSQGHEPTLSLLERIFPPGLIRYLKPQVVPVIDGKRGQAVALSPVKKPIERAQPDQQQQARDAGSFIAPAAGNNNTAITSPPSTITAQRHPTTNTTSAHQQQERFQSGTTSSSAAVNTDPLLSTGATAAAVASGNIQSGSNNDGSIATTTISYNNNNQTNQPQLPSGTLVGAGYSATSPRNIGGNNSGNTASNSNQQQQARTIGSSVAGGVGNKMSYQYTPSYNWQAFWSAVSRDHNHAGLIWNEQTRAELKSALQAEEGRLRLGRLRVEDSESSRRPSWNFAEFSVNYKSLSGQPCVGGYFLKLLLDGVDKEAVSRIGNPAELFTALHLRFLRLGDVGLSSSSLTLTSSSAASLYTSSGGTRGAGMLDSSHEQLIQQDPLAERELVMRAMAAVYAEHAGVIGPFEGMSHVAALMDTTESKKLRQCILLFMEASVNPKHLTTSKATQAAAKLNATSLVHSNGVDLMIDILASSHEEGSGSRSSTTSTALATHLISSSSHAEQVKPWFYYEATPKDASSAALAEIEPTKKGPITKSELKQLFTKGEIGYGTYVWTAGLQQPVELAALRELRWYMASKGSVGILTNFQAAERAIQVLSSLAGLCAAVDSAGDPVVPCPLAHRLMTQPHNMQFIAQVALTGEPSLVAASAALLTKILQHNSEAMARLYQTGAFFFYLAYCGSNFTDIALLFKESHLKQHFRGAGGVGSFLSLGERSVLGALLPESLLYTLESYGPAAFASALIADADTPEIIWTHDMRGKRLVPQMLRHLGDLVRRLPEHCHALYEFTPSPPVGYPELENELWCHRYYLRHLCDEDRFPDWPIVDHVPFLQALLDAWRAELARKPLGMTEISALKVLEIDVDNPSSNKTNGGNSDNQSSSVAVVDEETLKAAYRRLARRYHPDRNPAGRDRFLEVQRAYERLMAGAAGGQGPQPWRILLILKAQCILFKRYSNELAQYKYAGYNMLLQALTLGASNTGGKEGEGGGGEAVHFLSPDVAPRLQTAVELAWLTCAASPLNGDELTRNGGIALLSSLLSRCMAVLSLDVAPTDPAAVIVTHALRALTVAARFPAARKELEEESITGTGAATLVLDALKACALTRAPAAVDAALKLIAQLSVSPGLQVALLEKGALGYLIPLVLRYDETAEVPSPPSSSEVGGGSDVSSQRTSETSMQKSSTPPTVATTTSTTASNGNIPSVSPALAAAAVEKNAQKSKETDIEEEYYQPPEDFSLIRPNVPASRNVHAILALYALNALAGIPGGSHPSSTPKNIAAQEALEALFTTALAPKLSSKDPRPLLRMLGSTVTSPEAIWNEKMRQELLDHAEKQRNDPSVTSAGKFAYQALSTELVVNGVYVRVFAQYPTVQLTDPAAFCRGLVTKIYELQQQLQKETTGDDVNITTSTAEDQQKQRIIQEQHLLQCLHALNALFEGSPRLMGLLSTPAALSPLINCLQPACTLGHQHPLWPKTRAFFGQDAHNIDVAKQALEIMLRLTAHAGCLQALAADNSTVLSVFWLIHRPPDAATLSLALRFLSPLSSSAACAWTAASQGGAVYLLSIIVPASVYDDIDEEERGIFVAAREAAAGLLSRLCGHSLHGPRVVLLLSKLLPPGLLAAVQDGPGHAIIAAISQHSETPERLWTPAMKQTLCEEISHLASTARGSQTTSTTNDWNLPEGYSLRYNEVATDEVFVGGVYVRAYLKNPQFPLRDPKTFLEGLLKQFVVVTNSNSEDTDGMVMYSTAAVAVMEHHTLLAEHAAALGYVDKLTRMIASRVPQLGSTTDATPQPLCDEITLSTLRLLHQISSCTAAAEALARCTPNAALTLTAALQWGGVAAALSLEILKRGISPANRLRDNLVGGCVNAGFVPMVLNKLDWRASSSATGDINSQQEALIAVKERDEAVHRVLYIDILNLLSLDGAYAESVRSILDASEVWSAFKGQRHDLYLPAGAGATSAVAGLLTGNGGPRYALPASTASSSAVDTVVVVKEEESNTKPVVVVERMPSPPVVVVKQEQPEQEERASSSSLAAAVDNVVVSEKTTITEEEQPNKQQQQSEPAKPIVVLLREEEKKPPPPPVVQKQQEPAQQEQRKPSVDPLTQQLASDQTQQAVATLAATQQQQQDEKPKATTQAPLPTTPTKQQVQQPVAASGAPSTGTSAASSMAKVVVPSPTKVESKPAESDPLSALLGGG